MKRSRLYSPAQMATRWVLLALVAAAVVVVAVDSPPPHHEFPSVTGTSVSISTNDAGGAVLDGRTGGWPLFTDARRGGDGSSY